jgi:hypothetical protein
MSEKVDTLANRRPWRRRPQQEDEVLGGGINIELGLRSTHDCDSKSGRGSVNIRAAVKIAPMTLAVSQVGIEEEGRKDII